MDKESLLSLVSQAAAAKTISEQEVRSAFLRGQGTIAKPNRKISLVNILYGIGGLIVCIGIVLFFEQRWESLSSAAKILVTLGSGIVAYISGLLIGRTKNLTGVAWAFFLIFALLTPLGIYITLDTMDYQGSSSAYQNIITGIMFGWTLISFGILRLNLFRVFAVIFGSFFYFSLTGSLIGNNPAIPADDFFQYRFLILGISYVLFGYSWKDAARALVPWMYTFGTFMFLGAALALGGYAPSANQFWEVLFIGLAFGTMFLSITLKSRAMLVVSSLYLMAYIIKITAEYFSDTLGWPIALIIAGFVLMGIGFGTFRINQKYLKQESGSLVG